MSSSAGGGGGSSGGGGGDSFASAKQAMTSNAAYSAPTKTSAPTNTRGGGDNNYQDRIQRISTGTEPGYRPQDEQPFGLSKEEAYRQGRITKDQLEAPALLQSQAVDDR